MSDSMPDPHVLAAQLAGVGDQFFESMKPVLRHLADYHAVIIDAGLSQVVADELVLRQATLFGLKDAE